MTMIIRALVVEDSPSQAERIVQLISLPGVEVVACVCTEDQALEACERFHIDLAVIDLQLAQGTGFGIMRALGRRKENPARIIVLTNHAVPALKVASFEAGAGYFLDKSKDFGRLSLLAAELLPPRAFVRREAERAERTHQAATKNYPPPNAHRKVQK
jgi:two-component system OmpR family response regulator